MVTFWSCDLKLQTVAVLWTLFGVVEIPSQNCKPWQFYGHAEIIRPCYSQVCVWGHPAPRQYALGPRGPGDDEPQWTMYQEDNMHSCGTAGCKALQAVLMR